MTRAIAAQKSRSVTTRFVTLQRDHRSRESWPPLPRRHQRKSHDVEAMRARAQNTAAASPAAPAPTMTTSAVSATRIQQSHFAYGCARGAYKMQFSAGGLRGLPERRDLGIRRKEDRMKRFTSLAAAVFTAAFLAAATTVSAQDSNVDQRTYLTFSGRFRCRASRCQRASTFQARSDGASQRDAGVRR
jgi:hypothetical protein